MVSSPSRQRKTILRPGRLKASRLPSVVPAPVFIFSISGLTPPALARTVALRKAAEAGFARSLRPVSPALAGSMRATLATGAVPAGHGIVGEHWFDRKSAEIVPAVDASDRRNDAEPVWAAVRRRRGGLNVALLGLEAGLCSEGDAAMIIRGGSADADGNFALQPLSQPEDFHKTLAEQLGREFPAVNFAGPLANIESSRWLIEAAAAVHRDRQPDLCWVAVPHLSLGLLRWGPGSPTADADLTQLDELLSPLLERLISSGVTVVITGEYGIRSVSGAVFPNWALREAGLFRVQTVNTREHADIAACEAFAVVNRQFAHIYCRTLERRAAARAALEGLAGVERILSREEFLSGPAAGGGTAPAASEKALARCGDWVAIARPDRWFAYYWWFEGGKAPPFARSSANLRKLGVDPMELFINPRTKAIDFSVERIKGSFGLVGTGPADWPVLSCSRKVDGVSDDDPIEATAVAGMIRRLLE